MMATIAAVAMFAGQMMNDALRSDLAAIEKRHKLPALAAALIVDGRIADKAVVGVRQFGGQEPCGLEDLFHLGSCTKSMTATLAAMLVEDGLIRWDTTLSDVFTDVSISPELRSVTLDELLCHRSGLTANIPSSMADRFQHSDDPGAKQRRAVVEWALTKHPLYKPRFRYLYSNLGYAVAGAMLERRAGVPWEDLITNRLFKPLQMRSAGFGAPAKAIGQPEPWGHLPSKNGYVPVHPGPGDDNPAAIGPAATVHCTIEDFARYALFHLKGARGKAILLSAQSMNHLHSDPFHQSYGFGWIPVVREWAGGTAYNHGGSNTMFTSLVWLAPAKNFAVVVMTNAGSKDAKIACDDVVQAEIKRSLHA